MVQNSSNFDQRHFKNISTHTKNLKFERQKLGSNGAYLSILTQNLGHFSYILPQIWDFEKLSFPFVCWKLMIWQQTIPCCLNSQMLQILYKFNQQKHMVAKILEKVTDTTTPNQSEDTTFKFVELLSLLTTINRIDISSTAILSDNCSEYTRKFIRFVVKIAVYIVTRKLFALFPKLFCTYLSQTSWKLLCVLFGFKSLNLWLRVRKNVENEKNSIFEEEKNLEIF